MACRWRRSGPSWRSLRAGDWSRLCWHCAGSAGVETPDEVAMSNDAPPPAWESAPLQQPARWSRIRRILLWTTLLAFVSCGACLLLVLANGIDWVGYSDVELRFVVVDAE